MKKVLLCSIDAPFIGGAGTNAYNLIKLLRCTHDVVGLFIFTGDKYDKDPHKIGNIIKYDPTKDKLENIQKEIVKALNWFPDVIIAKNYIPVLISRKMFLKRHCYSYHQDHLFMVIIVQNLVRLPLMN